MDYINLPVFNPNVFSEDEDDLPGVSHTWTCLLQYLSLYIMQGGTVVSH